MSNQWPQNKRIIFHVDMDAFFAAIEELDNPAYRGKPIVVGADPDGGRGRGVASTCNYAARKYGIHSAMPISIAYRRCPHAIFLPGRFERYHAVSKQIMDIFGQYTPVVQAISIDEAFLDFTGTMRLYGTPEDAGYKLKNRIKQVTGLTASVGIAPNKFIAKIGSDLNKPDGMTICFPGDELAFLHPLEIERLWGVGKKTAEKLRLLGLKKIGDIAALPRQKLIDGFGKWGLHLWQLSHGIDNRSVEEGSTRKSISEETTFMQDVADDAEVEHALYKIADRVSRSMRRKSLKGRCITLKLRFENFETFSRSQTLSDFINDADTLHAIAIAKFRQFPRQHRRIRLVGIGVSRLNTIGGEQLNLFGDSTPPRNEKLEKILLEVKEKFGEKAATRASFLGKGDKTGRDG